MAMSTKLTNAQLDCLVGLQRSGIMPGVKLTGPFVNPGVVVVDVFERHSLGLCLASSNVRSSVRRGRNAELNHRAPPRGVRHHILLCAMQDR
jgi:hypothetical protein